MSEREYDFLRDRGIVQFLATIGDRHHYHALEYRFLLSEEMLALNRGGEYAAVRYMVDRELRKLGPGYRCTRLELRRSVKDDFREVRYRVPERRAMSLVDEPYDSRVYDPPKTWPN